MHFDNGQKSAIYSTFRLLKENVTTTLADMKSGISAPFSGRTQQTISLPSQVPLRFVCGWRGSTSGYFPMHSHPVVELVHHPRGSGVTAFEDGRKIGFQPHGTVIYPARLRHDERMTTPGVDICLHVKAPGEWLSEPLYIPPDSSGTKRADRFVRTEFLHLAQVRPDTGRRVELDLRITALLARLLQLAPLAAHENPPAIPETHVDRARQFICENYARITGAGEVARHVGVSEDYLRHLFIEHGGPGLNRLLNQTRVERVKELLVHSRLPIKAIASMSGFKTERYLSTRFKQFTGVGPSAFRRQSQR